jgi:hypothetical protein
MPANDSGMAEQGAQGTALQSNIAITSHMDANIQPKVASSWKAKMALALPTSGDATGESTIA